jgi:hypothetical protein
MDDWRIERLDQGHLRAGFDCGKSSLNDFVHSLVSQYEKRGLGRTYVAFQEGDQRVLGYYTLASGAIDAGSLPAKLAKKLPRHAVPVVLLARLAVDQSVHGRGLGGFLLRDALSPEPFGAGLPVIPFLGEPPAAFFTNRARPPHLPIEPDR